jgi:hypothetical protein
MDALFGIVSRLRRNEQCPVAVTQADSSLKLAKFLTCFYTYRALGITITLFKTPHSSKSQKTLQLTRH